MNFRNSQINELFEEVAKRKYGKYLMSIDAKKLRGFTEKKVTFDFPVTALIGPNGGGKLQYWAPQGYCIKTLNQKIFCKERNIDNLCLIGELISRFIDEEEDASHLILKYRIMVTQWSRAPLIRPIAVFGIAKTAPPSEKIEFSRYASNTFKFASQRNT